MKRCASGKSPVQLKPRLRHLDRMPIDRAVRDAGHHVRRRHERPDYGRSFPCHRVTCAAPAKRVDLPTASGSKMVFELSVGSRST